MKFINPSVEIILEDDPYKRIEIAGRTCYKSEDKITDESAKKFFNDLVKRNHTAMVEHVAFAFLIDPEYVDFYRKFEFAKYINATAVCGRYIVSGNLRALNEYEPASLLLFALAEHNSDYRDLCYTLSANELDDMNVGNIIKVITPDEQHKYFLTDLEKLTHSYTTFKFTEDRGVTHEHVRHRPASFAQESTRYCNYSKDGFDNEITYVLPTTFGTWPMKFQNKFMDVMSHIESVYLDMVNDMDPEKLQPQQARAILPQCTKSDIVITADGLEWNHIFNLRYKATTGKPHPDMVAIMTDAYPLYCKHVFDLEKDIKDMITR